MTTATSAPAGVAHPMLPTPYRVAWRRVDATDTATLGLDPIGEPLPAGLPGQFHMLYAFGVGEIPISLSGCVDSDAAPGRIEHTVRAVGAVSTRLAASPPGTVLGSRGPFGTVFDLDAHGGDLLIVAGGLGLAPLRPVVRAAVRHRRRYRRVVLVIGARSPDQLLFRDQTEAWQQAGVEVVTTVDVAPRGWTGGVGVVTNALASVELDGTATTAIVCGPEPMMRFTALHLVDRGIDLARIQVSLERTMHCAVGMCGRCQLGPLLVCRDGAVVRYPDVAEHWGVRER